MTFLDNRFKNFNFVADANKRKAFRKSAISFIKNLHDNKLLEAIHQRPSSPTLSETTTISSSSSNSIASRTRSRPDVSTVAQENKNNRSLFNVMLDSHYTNQTTTSHPASIAFEQEIKNYSAEQTVFSDSLSFFKSFPN